MPQPAAPAHLLIGPPREPRAQAPLPALAASETWVEAPTAEIIERGAVPRLAPPAYVMSDEAEYFLTGGVSLLGFTVDIHTGALRMPLDIDAILHDYFDEVIPAVNAALRTHVLAWYEQSATVYDRAAMAWAALLQSDHQIWEIILDVSNQLARVAVTDGIPWGEITQSCVVDAALQDRRLGRWVTQFGEQHARCVAAIGALSVEQFLEMSRREHQDNPQRAAIRPPRPMRLMPTLSKQDILRGRKVLRRGIALFERLFGSAIHDFVAKRPCVIQGHRYHYSALSYGNLIEGSIAPKINGHVVPYRLHLLRQDGVRLASCCVIFQDTPVIDQLVALALHVHSAASEDAILRIIKYSNCATEFYNDPYLMEIGKQAAANRPAIAAPFDLAPIPPVFIPPDAVPAEPVRVRAPVCPVEALVPSVSERSRALALRLRPVVRERLAALLPMSRATFDLMEIATSVDFTRVDTTPFIDHLRHVRTTLLAPPA